MKSFALGRTRTPIELLPGLGGHYRRPTCPALPLSSRPGYCGSDCAAVPRTAWAGNRGLAENRVLDPRHFPISARSATRLSATSKVASTSRVYPLRDGW